MLILALLADLPGGTGHTTEPPCAPGKGAPATAAEGGCEDSPRSHSDIPDSKGIIVNDRKGTPAKRNPLRLCFMCQRPLTAFYFGFSHLLIFEFQNRNHIPCFLILKGIVMTSIR